MYRPVVFFPESLRFIIILGPYHGRRVAVENTVVLSVCCSDTVLFCPAGCFATATSTGAASSRCCALAIAWPSR